jgi:hypothetical protein
MAQVPLTKGVLLRLRLLLRQSLLEPPIGVRVLVGLGLLRMGGVLRRKSLLLMPFAAWGMT